MSTAESEGEAARAPESTQDLTIFVQNLLQQMQGRFSTMSDAIIGRIDEMGARIDELESSIGDLMAQAGIDEEQLAEEGPPATAAATPAANQPAPPAPPR